MLTLAEIQKKTLIRLVDDDEDLRDTFSTMLSYEGWQVKTYAHAQQFLADDQPSLPGCLVLDVRLPGMTGTELQSALMERGYQIPIIILTGHANVDLAVTSFKQGAADFLQKPVDEAKLISVITQLAQDSLLQSLGVPTGKRLTSVLHALTERERAVLELMKEGVPPQQMAERLGISERTVYAHRVSVYQKLGTHHIELIAVQGAINKQSLGIK